MNSNLPNSKGLAGTEFYDTALIKVTEEQDQNFWLQNSNREHYPK